MKKYLLLLMLVSVSCFVKAQTDAINIKPTGMLIDYDGNGLLAIDPSAVLQLDQDGASTKGFLAPRVALTTNSTTAAPVVSPANSLLIYNTATVGDVIPGFYYWSTTSSSWVRLLSGSANGIRWDQILNPSAGLTLNHSTNPTVFNFANTTTDAFTINATAQTTGSLLTLTSPAAATGNTFLVTSPASGLVSNGIVRFNFTGLHGNNGFQVDDITTSGTSVAINASGVYTGTTGILAVTANSATTGTIAKISGTGLLGGNGLLIQGPTSGATLTGNLLQVATASTGAAANGFVRYNFSGAHTGNGLQIDDVTATGNAMAINANSVTTGRALVITSNGLTTGTSVNISSASTAGTASSSSTVLNLARSGVNANASHTAYGIQSAVTNTGTTNTNIAGYFSASGATNNYAIIVPSAGGNVGIGLLNPARILEIGGTSNTMRINGLKSGGTFASAINAANIMYADNATGDVYSLPTANNSTLTSDASGKLVWSSGTTSSLAWLLTGNAGTTPSVYADGGAQANNFIGTTDNQPVEIYTNSSASNAKSDMKLYTSVSPTQVVSAPVDVLHIRRNGTTGVTYPLSASFALGKYNNTISSESELAIKLGNGNVYVPDVTIMTMRGNGNVLVGSTTPGTQAARFSISASGTDLGGSAMSATFKTNSGTLGTTATNELALGSIGFVAGSNQVALGVRGYRASAGTDWTTSSIILGMDVDASVRPNSGGYISINANGSVGIGIVPTASTYKLNVSGGKLLTAGIDENSDVRLKKDINPITDALYKVLEMRGVTYHWRKDEFPERSFEADLQFGLIAQELEKIIPELVTTDEDGYKAIEYSHLVPVLIEAIKELEAKNETQQAVINGQQQANEELKASIENLVKRMSVIENNVESKTTKAENK